MDIDHLILLLQARKILGYTNGRQIRLAAGKTQAQLAGAIGATPSEISRLEAGERNPRPELLVRYAQALVQLQLDQPVALAA